MVSDHIATKGLDTALADALSLERLSVFRAPSRPNVPREELLTAARLMRKDAEHGARDYRPLMELFIDRLESMPGRNWQERWDASGAEQIPGAGSWANAFPGLQTQATAIGTGPGMGVSLLINVDALRPSAQFLARNGRIRLGSLLPWSSAGLEEANAQYHSTRTKAPANGRRALWVIQAATGKHLTEITADDLIVYTRLVDDKQIRATAGVAWDLLKILQIAPADAPSMHQLAHRGRRDVAQVVTFYDVQPKEVAEMFVRYLRTREPSMDYSSLRSLL